MRARLRPIPTIVRTVAAVSLLIAGCGSGSRTTAAVTTQNGLLGYSKCMRSHGVPNFPDPTSSGEISKDEIPVGSPHFQPDPTNQGRLTAQMVTAAGIDLHQPDLLRAGLACVPVTHGLLTRAAIERVVNGG